MKKRSFSMRKISIHMAFMVLLAVLLLGCPTPNTGSTSTNTGTGSGTGSGTTTGTLTGVWKEKTSRNPNSTSQNADFPVNYNGVMQDYYYFFDTDGMMYIGIESDSGKNQGLKLKANAPYSVSGSNLTFAGKPSSFTIENSTLVITQGTWVQTFVAASTPTGSAIKTAPAYQQ